MSRPRKPKKLTNTNCVSCPTCSSQVALLAQKGRGVLPSHTPKGAKRPCPGGNRTYNDLLGFRLQVDQKEAA